MNSSCKDGEKPCMNYQYLIIIIIINTLTALSLWLYSPLDVGYFFNVLILYTVLRTPWAEDQPVARPLTYTQKNINTE
jgi:hypothetical protein